MNNLKLGAQNSSDLNDSNVSTGNRGGAIFNQDDIMKNIEHRQISIKKSSFNKKAMEKNSNTGKSETLYSRETLPEDVDDVSKQKFEDYKIIRLIGRGTFGKVYFVENNKNKKLYAMKSIRKDVIIDHDSLESLKVEKLILLQVKHPFIISMEHVFAQETRIYFVMQFV